MIVLLYDRSRSIGAAFDFGTITDVVLTSDYLIAAVLMFALRMLYNPLIVFILTGYR
jgi:hypothetical protein